MTQSNSIAIRAMTPADIPFGMELKDLAGWNQLPADWERFIEWEPRGCFIATWDGEPAGTATTINYENRFGWVGMVLVHPDMRRRGIGTVLLNVCIEYLESVGVAAVKLDATPMGKELYDTLGFVEEYMVARHSFAAVSRGRPEGIEPLTAERLEAVLALDAMAFGADRGRVLERLQREAGVQSFVAMTGAEAAGYVFVRPGANADYLGPWVARDQETANALLMQVAEVCAGKTLYVDVCLRNPQAPCIARDHHFERQRHLIRMFKGENEHPGNPDWVYGIAGPEIG